LGDPLKGLAERIANSAHIFSTAESVVIQESEELFVKSEEMEIYSQTGPTFPEFHCRHHPNIVNGHHFLTSIFLPILIIHIVQFELQRAVKLEMRCLKSISAKVNGTKQMNHKSSSTIEISCAFLVFLGLRLIWIYDPKYASDLTVLSFQSVPATSNDT
jgi:hypothetical protein